MDYDATFTQRARAYTYAVKTYPANLKEEFSTAVKMCEPFSQGDRLVNIPAACIDIDPFLPTGVEHIAIETNTEFAKLNGVPVGSFNAIPLEDGAATHILCLASLHHATLAERQEFYAEAWRVLRPGGKLVLGDVAAETPQATWLNDFVDAHNSLGHKGLFWKEEDVEGFVGAGFRATTCLRSYKWHYAGSEAEIDFVRHLFGLDLATDKEIIAGLNQYFPGRVAGAEMPWALRYFIAVKPT